MLRLVRRGRWKNAAEASLPGCLLQGIFRGLGERLGGGSGLAARQQQRGPRSPVLRGPGPSGVWFSAGVCQQSRPNSSFHPASLGSSGTRQCCSLKKAGSS